MTYFVILTFLFVTGSFSGWTIELIYRRFFSKNNPSRKWINPGFLTGPYLPLYGFGLTTLYLLAIIPLPFIENEVTRRLVLFTIMAIAMTVIEYIAGKIFIIGMHVRLWDYSKEWGNIKGIICPKFSFYWALLGAGYYFLIHPSVESSLSWLFDNLAYCLVIGFIAGIYSVDICYSLNLATKIRAIAKERDIVVRYEELKAHIAKIHEESRQKVKFLFAFQSEIPIIKHVEKYIEVHEAFKTKAGTKADDK